MKELDAFKNLDIWRKKIVDQQHNCKKWWNISTIDYVMDKCTSIPSIEIVFLFQNKYIMMNNYLLNTGYSSRGASKARYIKIHTKIPQIHHVQKNSSWDGLWQKMWRDPSIFIPKIHGVQKNSWINEYETVCDKKCDEIRQFSFP